MVSIHFPMEYSVLFELLDDDNSVDIEHSQEYHFWYSLVIITLVEKTHKNRYVANYIHKLSLK